MEMLNSCGKTPTELGALEDTDREFIEASWHGKIDRMIEANDRSGC